MLIHAQEESREILSHKIQLALSYIITLHMPLLQTTKKNISSEA